MGEGVGMAGCWVLGEVLRENVGDGRCMGRVLRAGQRARRVGDSRVIRCRSTGPHGILPACTRTILTIFRAVKRR